MTVPLPRGPASAPPTGVPPIPDSAVTRHLCAAAYLDDGFREEALREVYDQPKRVPAPSYGFRLIPVLAHCLRARRAATIRDGIITGLLVLLPCLGGPWMFAFLALLYVGVVIGRILRPNPAGRAKYPVATADTRPVQATKLLLAIFILLLFGIPVALLAISAFLDSATSGLFGTQDSSPMANFVVTTIIISVLSMMMTAVLITPAVVIEIWAQRQLHRLGPGAEIEDPPRSDRFDTIHKLQQGNTVVYSGYRPFVGSGEVIDSWGFAQRLVRPVNGIASLGDESEREFEQAPFTAQKILTFVAEQLRSLATDPVPERQLPGLTVTDTVFRAGTDVSHPSTVTDPDLLAAIIRHPTTPARHYLACQVASWNGELVTSVYVHFAVQGRSLYLQVTTTALPPCDERFRIVDQIEAADGAAYLRAIARAVARSPRVTLTAPLNLARAAVGAADSSRRKSDLITPGVDYGARVSVRELGAAEVTRNHIQTQDLLKHKRIIERRVVAAVLDFLEDHEVDTSEYRHQTLNVLTAAAVNTGSGSMYVESAIAQQNNQAVAGPPAGTGK
jgi:hypothetical protein